MFESIILAPNPLEKFKNLVLANPTKFYDRVTRNDMFLLLNLDYSISEYIWTECIHNVFDIRRIMNYDKYTPEERQTMNSITITDVKVPTICIVKDVRFYITIMDLTNLSQTKINQVKAIYTENDLNYFIWKKNTKRR